MASGEVRRPMMIEAPISAAAINAEGSSPAMNSPPMERLATKPRMIRFTQGGIVSAITAEAASNATASPGFCPDLRAAGTSTEPTAAISAIFEPEMPEKITMLSTITTSSPPRMRPAPRCSREIRRTDMPFASIRYPTRMKNGTASSTKLSIPRAICWAKISPGSMSPHQMKISVASASTKAIGTPIISATTNAAPISNFRFGSASGSNAE